MKQVLFDSELRDKLFAGIKKISKAVSVTLGPKGQNVIIDIPGSYPHVTKDGVTVAKSIFFSDKFENMGAMMIRQVAEQTANTVGDGTTTSTVLTEKIISDGLEAIKNKKLNPVFVKKGIEMCKNRVVEHIKSISVQINDDDDKILNVAKVSSNNDEEISQNVFEAVKKAGSSGNIKVVEGRDTKTIIHHDSGYRIESGYPSTAFVNDHKRSIGVYPDCLILIVNDNIKSVEQILPALDFSAKMRHSLLIIADEYQDSVLKNIVANRQQGDIQISIINAYGYGKIRSERMEDIAIVTGAKVIGGVTGLSFSQIKNINPMDYLGVAENVFISRDHTIIQGGKGDKEKINNRIELIKNSLSTLTNEMSIIQETERLGVLSEGVVTIVVGANSEVEMKEKKDRIDDAVQAVLAALKEGVVPGGGYALYDAFITIVCPNNLPKDEEEGYLIMLNSLSAPLKTMAKNAGLSPEEILDKVYNDQKGFNFVTNKTENLIETGIIDPAMVTRLVIENAASVASTFLTICAGVSDEIM